MFGFFVFLTIWGIVDAIIHSAAVTYATNVFGDDIGANNLGMLAMAAMPTLSAKTLAMFGIIRSSGLMLAAVLSGMVIRFGGTALAHLAGSLTSIANQGGLAGGRMLTPEGCTLFQQQQRDRKASSESLNSGGTDASSRAQGETYKKTLAASLDKNIGEGSDFATRCKR